MQQNACVETVSVSQFYLTNLVQDELFEKIKLTNSAKIVLLRLVRHYNPEKATVYPSQDFIAKKTDITKRSVINSINELRKKGLIIYDTKNVNHYRFTPLFWKLVNFSPSEEISPEGGKNFTSGSEIFSPKQIKENINKKDFKNFKNKKNNYLEKKESKNFSNQQKGVTYKNPQQTKQMMQESLKVDDNDRIENASREKALNMYKQTPELLRKKSIICTQLMNKWNFSAEELNAPVENFQPETKSHILGDNLTSEVDKESFAEKSSLQNTGKILSLMDFKHFPKG